MAWLRIDDGFTKHPKFEGWKASERWAWLECMEYCARYRTGGRIPTDPSLLPRAATTALLTRAEESGWVIRREDGALWINDWDEFNPADKTGAERQARHRERARKTAAHKAVAKAVAAGELVREPCAVCGATRDVVAHHEDYSNQLEVVWLCRIHHAERHAELATSNGESDVTRNVTRNDGDRYGNGSTRARVSARSRPVPSPRTTKPAAAATTPAAHETANGAAAALLEDHNPELVARLDDLGLNPTQILNRHPADLVQAWIDLATTEAKNNPAGYILAGLQSGHPPSPRTPTRTAADPAARRTRFVQTNGWRLPDDELAYQLVAMGATTDELEQLHQIALELRAAAAA